MKGLRMRAWMAGLCVGLVLLVAAGLVPGGLLLLRRVAAEGASARVQLAAASALEGLRREGEEVLTSARLLAERPTLLQMIRDGEGERLSLFLEQFRATSHLDGCAVWTEDGLFAAAPPAAPWAAIHAGTADGPGHFVLEQDSPPCVAARAALAEDARGEALVFRRLDAAAAARLEAQAGLPVGVLADAAGSEGVTREPDGSWRARRFAGDGAGSIGVEVFLPASEVAAVLRPVERSFAVVTAAAVFAAVAAGFLAARRLTRPLTRLEAAAVRIGVGDLATPVPAVPGVEAGALASTMEAMRRSLQSTAAELRERQLEARALLEGMVEGVFAVDGDRRIQYLNPQAARRLGILPAEAIGRFCGDVLRPLLVDGRRPCEDACPIVHARSRGSSRAVEHIHGPQGRRTVVVTSAPPAGLRQVQLLRDETEIEAARRSRDALLANVSHELKTPLAAQMASIQLLEDALGEAAPEAATELLESLERSTLRLARLIDNLLESVRIETGQASLRRVEVDLAFVVSEAEAMTHLLLRQRRQELVLDLPEALPRVSGDPVQLTQVFVNLLVNANKFSPEASAIRVGARCDSATASVWIEDSGPGIPAHERRSVFEHYYRADPAAADGMGLGLWLVKSIVERHGGRVEVDASPGGGARFTVTLPRVTLA